MAGYSDQPFRSLCRELGSAMSYTEFINAIEIVQNRRLSIRLEQRLAYLPEERPVVFQLFDNDPDRLLQAALKLQAYNRISSTSIWVVQYEESQDGVRELV